MPAIESESLRADGRTVPVEIRVVRVEYDGAPALLFHVRDITERRAAEMALRSSETLFRSVWENSVDGMRLTDENGTIIAANQAFCRLVGLAHEQLEGKPFHRGLCGQRGLGGHAASALRAVSRRDHPREAGTISGCCTTTAP